MMMPVDLTEAEWCSLRELRNGPLKKAIPSDHENKFIILGLAKKLFAGVVVTDQGRRYRRSRDAAERGPASAEHRPAVLRLVPVSIEATPPLHRS